MTGCESVPGPSPAAGRRSRHRARRGLGQACSAAGESRRSWQRTSRRAWRPPRQDRSQPASGGRRRRAAAGHRPLPDGGQRRPHTGAGRGRRRPHHRAPRAPVLLRADEPAPLRRAATTTSCWPDPSRRRTPAAEDRRRAHHRAALLSLFGALDAVVAMRYHAYLFAERAGVPLIPIAYADKSVTWLEERGIGPSSRRARPCRGPWRRRCPRGARRRDARSGRTSLNRGHGASRAGRRRS